MEKETSLGVWPLTHPASTTHRKSADPHFLMILLVAGLDGTHSSLGAARKHFKTHGSLENTTKFSGGLTTTLLSSSLQ